MKKNENNILESFYLTIQSALENFGERAGGVAPPAYSPSRISSQTSQIRYILKLVEHSIHDIMTKHKRFRAIRQPIELVSNCEGPFS